MISKASERFWSCFASLPIDAQKTAIKQYALFRIDPFHPSLHFKQLIPGLWSIRVSIGYRALAYREDNLLNWYWIGTHAEYDRLIK